MSEREPWYVTRRAEVMAEVALTRRSGVRVSRPASDRGLPFLVSLEQPAHMFGVEVKGGLGIEKLISEDGRVREATASEVLDRARDYPFPVLLLLFDMRDDAGYYTWLVKPATDAAEGSRALQLVHTPIVQSLTNAALDAALDEIARWYGARVLQAA